MSRVLKVSNDNYTIQTASKITLDPTSAGTVIITGNLDVKGTTTTVESTNSTIADNIIQLNQGQTGNGISSANGYISGIDVERGAYTPAQWVFSESVSHSIVNQPIVYTATVTEVTTNLITLSSVTLLTIGSTIVFSGSVFGGVSGGQVYYITNVIQGSRKISISLTSGGGNVVLTAATGSMTATINNLAGTWVAQYGNGSLTGIQASSFATGANLDFVFDMLGSSAVMRIANSPSYTTLVNNSADLNTIITKGWAQGYVSASGITPGMADVDKLYYTNSGTIYSRIQAYQTSVNFYVNQTQRATLTATGLSVDNVNIYQDTVSNTSVSSPLILTATNSQVKITGVINLDDTATSPSSTAGTSKIYSKSASGTTPGKTGIYFANPVNSDELVAKNRALLFSMLF
jgi:hypothetical protein